MLVREYAYHIIFIVLVATLLVGQQFGYSWAGGPGIVTYPDVTISDDLSFARGETISSSVTDFFAIGDVGVWLDENTDVKLIDTRPESAELVLVQGRMVTAGAITVTVRDVHVKTNGVTSLVHYSWLNKLDIASLQGEAKVMTGADTSDISLRAITINTLPPYAQEEIPFDPATSSASTFYERVLKQ